MEPENCAGNHQHFQLLVIAIRRFLEKKMLGKLSGKVASASTNVLS